MFLTWLQSVSEEIFKHDYADPGSVTKKGFL